jgi:tRNA threonylcarbamoyl adenosine modification protein YeaZ
MNLLLALDTSRRPFNVVLGRGEECLFDSLSEPEMSDPRDLPAMVAEAFRRSGHKPRDLRAIALSVGPGALGSVRSGVSFGNALAYSLGVPVYPVTSFELMGFAVARRHKLPVLCSARASNGTAYVGLYRDAALTYLTYGRLETLAVAAAEGLDQVAVAGQHRPAVQALLGADRVIDSGVEQSLAATCLALGLDSRGGGMTFPELVTPITETSELLTEPPQDF